MIAFLFQSGVASIMGIVLLLILLVAVWSSVESVPEYEASVVANNRSTISYRIRRELNPVAEEWGMRVEHVDIRRVDLPKESDQP